MAILRCYVCFDASFRLPQNVTWVVLCDAFISTAGITELPCFPPDGLETPPAVGPVRSAPSLQAGYGWSGAYPLPRRWKYDNVAQGRRTETRERTMGSGKYSEPLIYFFSHSVIVQPFAEINSFHCFPSFMHTQHPVLSEKHRLGEMFADLVQNKHWDITWHHINSGAIQFFWPHWNGPAPSL